MTILAVDDSTESLIAIKAIIGDAYDLCIAKSGCSALKALARSKVDLILLDVQMPEMSGFELFAELQKDPSYSKIPVIFLTASVTGELVAQMQGMGAKGYLEKPVHTKVLRDKLKEVLG